MFEAMFLQVGLFAAFMGVVSYVTHRQRQQFMARLKTRRCLPCKAAVTAIQPPAKAQ